MKRIIRVYVDTSVFGGVYDDEFAAESQSFFNRVKAGDFALVTSGLVRNEIADAPPAVQEFFREIVALADIIDVNAETLGLSQEYLNAGIVSPQWRDDAMHVALATVAGCTLIVSWNFKHIVHYQKIPRYNAINALQGYPAIAIHSPMEMIADEKEEDI
ncbi:MAG: type II toxin-antitoxin system VapC family toxin [Armatimonadota bacterium]